MGRSVSISELAGHLQAGLETGKSGCVHAREKFPFWLGIGFASSDHRQVSGELGN